MIVKLKDKGYTKVLSQDGRTQVIYHGSVIVCFNSNKVILSSHGWRTSSTKQRINQASEEFGLGFTVYQKNWNWYVNCKGGSLDIASSQVFHDGIELERV